MNTILKVDYVSNNSWSSGCSLSSYRSIVVRGMFLGGEYSSLRIDGDYCSLMSGGYMSRLSIFATSSYSPLFPDLVEYTISV